MKAVFFAALALALSGCMEAEPQAPHPAMVKLQQACDAGDTAACGQVIEAEQRNQALRQQAGAQLMSDMAAAQRPIVPYQMQGSQTRQTTCTPIYGTGGMNCMSY